MLETWQMFLMSTEVSVKAVLCLCTCFISCIEILSASVLKNQDITGIKINEKEFKSTMFADDAISAMGGSLKSFQTLLDILDEFKQISGLSLM